MNILYAKKLTANALPIYNCVIEFQIFKTLFFELKNKKTALVPGGACDGLIPINCLWNILRELDKKKKKNVSSNATPW